MGEDREKHKSKDKHRIRDREKSRRDDRIFRDDKDRSRRDKDKVRIQFLARALLMRALLVQSPSL